MVFENYEIDDFWSKSEERPEEESASIYPQIIGSKIVFPNTKIRTMPYELEFPLHLEQTTQVFLPSPWTIDEEDITMEENGIFFSKKVTKDGSTVTIKYVYRTLQQQIEAKKIAAFIATHKKIQNQLGYTFTQAGPNGTAAASANGSEDKNPLFLLFFFIGLGLIGVACYKINKYDPLPADLRLAQYPLPVGGWLVLTVIGLAVTVLQVIPQIAG